MAIEILGKLPEDMQDAQDLLKVAVAYGLALTKSGQKAASHGKLQLVIGRAAKPAEQGCNSFQTPLTCLHGPV